jgi:hypothetical protein
MLLGAGAFQISRKKVACCFAHTHIPWILRSAQNDIFLGLGSNPLGLAVALYVDTAQAGDGFVDILLVQSEIRLSQEKWDIN